MKDYHLHSRHSFDAGVPVNDMARAAVLAGADEICFTDHVDFDGCSGAPCDMAAQRSEIDQAREDFPALTIRRGAEISLLDADCAQRALGHVLPHEPDFIIASLHMIDGMDVYFEEFFEGRSRQESYGLYLGRLAKAIRTIPAFSVLGHYDFVAKRAPYGDRRMTYGEHAGEFDAILGYLADSGHGMEVNTSAWLDGPAWGLDVLTRFRELGGEFVTFGSDAHKPMRVAKRLQEAKGMALAAGIRYTASFERLKPNFIKL